MKLVLLITECLNLKSVQANISLLHFQKNCLKKGNDLSALIFNVILKYLIRNVRESKQGIELDRLLQVLCHAGNVNLLGENINIIKHGVRK